jgi:hypothetical protein
MAVGLLPILFENIREVPMGKAALSKITLANVVVLCGFTVFFLIKANYEFLIYAVTLGVAIYLIERTDKVFHYSRLAKVGFGVWLLLHLSGGSFYINGERVYDTMLISILGEPYHIFKFDQAIHMFCYFVITLFLYSMVVYISADRASRIVTLVIVGLASMGVSALNEIIEFSAVVFFNSQGVGGYYNNSLDLVFNLIGILAAVVVAGKVWKRVL